MCEYNINISAINGKMKQCCKCKNEKQVTDFGKLKSSVDGLRYDCNDCRKEYREKNRLIIKSKQNEYYENNKQDLLNKNKLYRIHNQESIRIQRKEYRSRDKVKEHIALKNKEYLPKKKEQIKIRRKTDLNFQLSEVLRSKIHKMLKNKNTTYTSVLGCDLEFFKSWIQFRFDSEMAWDNFGTLWQIDHILPISLFNLKNTNEIKTCFHWTNLQPLYSDQNRLKSNKLELHHYFNNIVNVNRFNKYYTQYLGYQNLNESLNWLRSKLRYGENPSDEDNLICPKLEISSQDSKSVMIGHE